MTPGRSLLLLVGGAAVLGLFWVVLYALQLYRATQREEGFYARAVRETQPQSEAAYVALRNRTPVLEWDDYTPGGRRFVIRVHADRRVLFAAFRAGTGSLGMPDRYFAGRASGDAWAALEKALESPALRQVGYGDAFDVKIQALHADGRRRTYTYAKPAYAELPPALQALDQAIIALLAPAWIQPDRDYALAPVALTYGADDVPALSRALRSDRDTAWPSIVARLVAAGEPGFAALADLLVEGAADDFRPSNRYLAIVDGVAPSSAAVDHLLPALRTLAAFDRRLPGPRSLQARASELVAAREVSDYLRTRFAVPAALVRALDRTQAPESLAAAFEEHRRALDVRLEERRAAAREAIVALGAGALPLVMGQLREDRAEGRRVNPDLVAVLAALAGPDALLHGVQQGVLDSGSCIAPLRAMGGAGLPALLLLLDVPDRHGQGELVKALSVPAYSTFVSELARALAASLDRLEAAPDGALRAVHQATAGRLVEALRAHGAEGPAVIDALARTAATRGLADPTRIAAVEALGALGPSAAAALQVLRGRLGFEHGPVRDALLVAIGQIDGP